MEGKQGLLMLLSKRAKDDMDYGSEKESMGDGEYMGYEVAAKDMMQAIRDDDTKLFSYALKDFVHMCMGHGEDRY